MTRRHQEAEPETRVGICCGCSAWTALLFKVPGVYRYRCAACYRSENGTDHPLCRRVFTVRRAARPDAGGPLVVAVDQFGIESGDIPSYDGAAVAERCDELNARQMMPLFDPLHRKPCQCGHPGNGLPPYCFQRGGGQLQPGYHCKLISIAPTTATEKGS